MDCICFLFPPSSFIVHRPSFKLEISSILPPFRFEHVICVSFSNTKEKGMEKKEEALQYTTLNKSTVTTAYT